MATPGKGAAICFLDGISFLDILRFNRVFLNRLIALALLDYAYAESANGQGYAGYNHHDILRSQCVRLAEGCQNPAAGDCGYNLRQTDGAVEQAEICADVAALQRVCKDGKRPCKHSGPGATYQQEGYEQQILVGNQAGEHEAYTAQDEREGVREFAGAEAGENYSPEHRAHGLYGKEDTYPVARFVILLGRGVEVFVSAVRGLFDIGNSYILALYYGQFAGVGIAGYVGAGREFHTALQPFEIVGHGGVLSQSYGLAVDVQSFAGLGNLRADCRSCTGFAIKYLVVLDKGIALGIDNSFAAMTSAPWV